MKELFLLDTCVWIWLVNGDSCITPAIQNTLAASDWLVSAISVWEVAMLEAKQRIKLSLSLMKWVDEALTKIPGILLVPLSPAVAITSCSLKNDYLRDPADRMIIATAIHHHATLVTADNQIISYCQSQRIPVMKI